MDTKWFLCSKRWWCTGSANKASLGSLVSTSFGTAAPTVKPPNIPQAVGWVLFLQPTPFVFKTCINSAILVMIRAVEAQFHIFLQSFLPFLVIHIFSLYTKCLFVPSVFLEVLLSMGSQIFLYIYLNLCQRRCNTMKASSLTTWSQIRYPSLTYVSAFSVVLFPFWGCYIAPSGMCM